MSDSRAECARTPSPCGTAAKAAVRGVSCGEDRFEGLTLMFRGPRPGEGGPPGLPVPIGREPRAECVMVCMMCADECEPERARMCPGFCPSAFAPCCEPRLSFCSESVVPSELKARPSEMRCWCSRSLCTLKNIASGTPCHTTHRIKQQQKRQEQQ